MNEDIRVTVCPLPGRIKEYVVLKDGYYTIIINECLCAERRYEAYKHALRHILSCDFEKKCDADVIEMWAHREEEDDERGV